MAKTNCVTVAGHKQMENASEVHFFPCQSFRSLQVPCIAVQACTCPHVHVPGDMVFRRLRELQPGDTGGVKNVLPATPRPNGAADGDGLPLCRFIFSIRDATLSIPADEQSRSCAQAALASGSEALFAIGWSNAAAAANDAQGSSACRLFRDMPRLTGAGMGGSSGGVRSSARVWAKKQTDREQADASLHSWVQYLAGCNQHSNTPCAKRQASPRLQLPCRTTGSRHTPHISVRGPAPGIASDTELLVLEIASNLALRKSGQVALQ